MYNYEPIAMKKLQTILVQICLVLFVSLVLFLGLRGLPGNPTSKQLNTPYWKDNGPFELSPERGRFALLYSVVENHTLNFPVDIARFTSPDVGYLNHHYVSIFAPSLSFLAIPGYVIGKYFGLSQVGTFAWIALFAVVNVLLIRLIAIRLGAHPLAATIAALTFLFATPAFAYAVTIYEHHASTFLLLLGFYLLLRYNNIFSLLAIWFLYAFSFTVDYPNIFMMLPIAVAAFFRIGAIQKAGQQLLVKISFPRILTIAIVLLPMISFLWFNKVYYGNPMQLSGTVARVLGVKPNGSPLLYVDLLKKRAATQKVDLPPPGSVFTMFQTRNMINGLYILFLSPDRGTIFYAPVILFGIVGLVLAYRRKLPYLSVLLAIIGIDVLLYAMWGDPYGGWAFGARYLIPAYAVFAVLIALALTYWKKYNFFLLFFFIIFVYSAAVNTIGAVTSNSNPPQVEAYALSAQTHTIQQYTYMRNITMLENNVSKTFVFQQVAQNYVSAWTYCIIVIFAIVAVTGTMLGIYRLRKGGDYAV